MATRLIATAGGHSVACGRGAAAPWSRVRGGGSQPVCGHSHTASVPAGGVSDGGEKAEVKPVRYLVAKGQPTLPQKLVEKVWRLEYMEFLLAPRSLRLAEQGKPSTLPVEAFDQPG